MSAAARIREHAHVAGLVRAETRLIGRRIAERRAELGLDLDAIAGQTGRPPSLLMAIERGDEVADLDDVLAYALALDCTIALAKVSAP